MTMSQLLKQTKKCCIKIIRKLSFTTSNNTSSPTTSNGKHSSLNNRVTAKYVLHKNCTPTRCKIQPISPQISQTSLRSWNNEPVSEENSVPVSQNNYQASRNDKNLKKRTNLSSNKNMNIKKCFRSKKSVKEYEIQSSLAQSSNDKVSKILYNENDEEIVFTESKIYENNLASNNQCNEKNKIAKPLFLNSKLRNYDPIEEFEECQCKKLQYELQSPLPECNNYEEIVFEKVNYDSNKRYLVTNNNANNTNNSPSTASSRSRQSSFVINSNDSIDFDNHSDYNVFTSRPLSHYNGVINEENENETPWRNYNLPKVNKINKNPWDYDVIQPTSPLTSTLLSPLASRTTYQRQSKNQSQPLHANVTKVGQFENIQDHENLWSTLDNSLNNETAVRAYKPTYVVKTDIWQNLNNKNYEIDSDVIWRTNSSSRRTSTTTIETWIDDEIFDNSFNEELERRCASLNA